MKAPIVDKSMSQDDAQRHLQFALDHLARIYTIIGNVPYEESKDFLWKPLIALYDDAVPALHNLATDPIPF